MSSDTEVAWAAGFFDGEGSLTFDSRKAPKWSRVRITNTERVLLERFIAAVGVGVIKDLKTYSPLSKKPNYVVAYGAQAEVRIVLGLLIPYLGPRKKERALAMLAHYPTAEQKRLNHSEAARKRWATRRANLAAE